jgi:Mg-chelatase subunit ChlD
MEQGMRPQQPDQPQPGQGDGQDGQDGQDGSEGGEGQRGSEGQSEGQDGSEGQGEGQDGSEGQGEGQDGSEGQGEGQDGSEGQGEGQDGSEGQGQSGDSTGSEGRGDGSPIASDADLSKTVDKIAERAGIADLDDHAMLDGSHALSTVRSTIGDPLRGLAVDAGMNAIAARDLQSRLPRNAVLHGQIGRLLVSDEVRRVTHHETSGRLDRRALARMRCGATDVFSRKDDQPGIDTALLVLIDGSSSMAARGIPLVNETRGQYMSRPSRMAIAQTAAWHIARAAEAANARVCVAVFHSKRDRHGDAMPGAKITVLKPWEVPIQDRAAVLAACEINGATPMSPAIIECSGMLSEVNATRHILMVLTDGQCDYGPAGVTRACVLAGDVGVEVVGVGMSCASVIAAFPPRYSVNVENIDQLAQAGLGVLVSMLEDANPRGAD